MALRGLPSIGAYNTLGGPTGATNLITNGGFETDTTGWSTLGTNTIQRVTSDQHSGAACLQVTRGDQPQHGARYAITFPAAGMYTISAWVKFSADAGLSSGLPIRLDGVTDDVLGVNVAADPAILDVWQRVYMVTTIVTDLDGIIVVGTTTWTLGTSFMLDDVQVEAGPAATPYVPTDGATASRTAMKWIA